MGLKRISSILIYRSLHQVYRSAIIYFSAIRGYSRGGSLEGGDGCRTGRGEARSRGGGAQRRGALIEPVTSSRL